MTEAEIAEFQANLLQALFELNQADEIRSRLTNSPGAAYLATAEDAMLEVAAELVKTWGKIDRSLS
jgi:hypothetical protein